MGEGLGGETREVYDLENDEYLFPLLEDLANGELRIFDNRN